MTDARRLAAACGVAAPAVAWTGVLAATLVSPTFSWATGALSDLGVTPGAPALLFNGGLLAGATIALPFAWWLWVAARTALQRAGAVTFALASLGMGGVGAFPSGHPLHVPAAAGFFLGFTYALFCHGSGTALAGRVGDGLVAIWLAVAHVTAWLVWGAALATGDSPILGLALPEAAGAVVLAAWTIRTARTGPEPGR